jgi:hypothetical protein
MFSKHGVLFEQSARPKSDLYIELLALINSKRVELLDNNKAINQLCGLERRVFRGGRDSVDHAPNQHDDLANVIAGCCALSNQHGGYTLLPFDPNYVDPDATPQPPAAQPDAARFYGTSEWWRATPAAQQPITSSSANDRMKSLYGGFEFAAKYGVPPAMKPMKEHPTLSQLHREALTALLTMSAIMAGAAIYVWWLS